MRRSTGEGRAAELRNSMRAGRIDADAVYALALMGFDPARELVSVKEFVGWRAIARLFASSAHPEGRDERWKLVRVAWEVAAKTPETSRYPTRPGIYGRPRWMVGPHLIAVEEWLGCPCADHAARCHPPYWSSLPRHARLARFFAGPNYGGRTQYEQLGGEVIFSGLLHAAAAESTEEQVRLAALVASLEMFNVEP